MLNDRPIAPVVVKVGGSLFDLPDLGSRLRRVLAGQSGVDLVLVPGGGKTVDAVRALDQRHDLGEAASHWLALTALTLNARFLAQLLTRPVTPPLEVVVSGDVKDWPALWRRRASPILDAFAFAQIDENQPDHLPHCWDVTSDSIAVRVASVVGAKRLILLKSIGLPARIGWFEAAERGFVDPFFPNVVGNLEVEVINLRHWFRGSMRPDPVPGLHL